MAVVIDPAGYKALTPEQKTEYKNQLLSAVENAPGLTPEQRAEMKESADAYIQGWLDGNPQDFDLPPFTSPATYPAPVYNDIKAFHFIILAPSVEEVFKYNPTTPTPAAIEATNDFFLSHETFHALYDLNEPGADFIAAVESLINNPDSRNILEAIADYRSFIGLGFAPYAPPDEKVLDEFFSGGSHNTATEAASGIALRAALAITPQRLDELRRMTPEERHKALLEEAKGFDSQFNAIAKDKTNETVFKEIFSRASDTKKLGEELRKGKEDNALDPFLNKDTQQMLADAARKLLDECNTQTPPPFPPGSKEYEILKNYVDAVSRIAPEQKIALAMQQDLGVTGRKYLSAISTYELYRDDPQTATQQLLNEGNLIARQALKDYTELRDVAVSERSELFLMKAHEMDYMHAVGTLAENVAPVTPAADMAESGAAVTKAQINTGPKI